MPAETHAPLALETLVTGRLHCVVSFDWGEEVNLQLAASLVPSEPQNLPRRRRTPATISYRPAPLLFRLKSTELDLPGLQETLFHQIAPAIKDPQWGNLFEEYFTFEITPGPNLPAATDLLRDASGWLASLLRLDDEPMSEEEVAEALRHRLSYRPQDIVLVEWAAAIVLDRDCDETLRIIEFANLQLLEYRFLDRRIEDVLAKAQGIIQPAARSWLRFLRTHSRPLRILGEIRLDTVATYERASSTLQLVGDQYLSRVYRMLSSRFCLNEWSKNVRRSLDVAQGVHEILSSQSAMYRLELLELIVVLLIALEIGLAFANH